MSSYIYLLFFHFYQQGQIYAFIECLIIIDFASVISPIIIFFPFLDISSAYKYAVLVPHFHRKTFQDPTSPSSYSIISLQFFIAKLLGAAHIRRLRRLRHTCPALLFLFIFMLCLHHSFNAVFVGNSEVYLGKSSGPFSALGYVFSEPRLAADRVIFPETLCLGT